ncbi:hypothetical protein MU0053_004224 [[Mycobacterium] burgundiense]|uniref:Uncharacterized protein n=1 Tax=[Mycobacterium] burgundiense TaxID=3064286 RepID=A0ABM9M3K0_9MYCO|nr:hypothetical protein MU0053_004224 [Mycolicibacterium sp. MU0053]
MDKDSSRYAVGFPGVIPYWNIMPRSYPELDLAIRGSAASDPRRTLKNRFEKVYFSAEHRYVLGIDRKTDGYYLAIPVTNGLVDYDELYLLSEERYRRYLEDVSAAVAFAERCRRRECDDLLIYAPGSNRGIPM